MLALLAMIHLLPDNFFRLGASRSSLTQTSWEMVHDSHAQSVCHLQASANFAASFAFAAVTTSAAVVMCSFSKLVSLFPALSP